MNRIRYLSISTRISILLGLIILVTMGSFTMFSLLKQEKDSVDSLSRSTLLLSQTTEKILRLSMLKNRRDEISTAIRNIVGEQGIQSVRILNHKGIIKFSSRKSEIDEHISKTNQLCSNCHIDNDSLTVHAVSSFYSYHFNHRDNIIFSSLPIYNSRSCYTSDCHTNAANKVSAGPQGLQARSVHDSSQTILGFIEIEVSAKKIMANIARSRTELILLTIIIAILASTVTYFITRRLVGNPVKRLVEGTRRVAQGDFNREIPTGKAELGVLADSFNQMQRQLLATQSQLIESEKLASVGKLADEIASEINNPLTGIIVYSESLIGEAKSDSDYVGDLEIIYQEALKIRESVRNILSLARRGRPNFVPVDLNGTVNHAVSILKNLSHFRNIRIVASIPRSCPKVTADPMLLQQVFLNLFLIFSDSMKAGGILNVSASHLDREGTVEIRLSATGGSIHQSVLDALSNQGEVRNSDIFEKSKISLSVCKDIISIHRGRIYSSAEPGAETSLVIELPV